MVMKVRLEQLPETLDRKVGLLEEVGDGAPLQGFVRRHSEFQQIRADAFVESDVAATLSDHDPAIPLQGAQQAVVPNRRGFQTTISATSAPAGSAESSGTSSR